MFTNDKRGSELYHDIAERFLDFLSFVCVSFKSAADVMMSIASDIDTLTRNLARGQAQRGFPCISAQQPQTIAPAMSTSWTKHHNMNNIVKAKSYAIIFFRHCVVLAGVSRVDDRSLSSALQRAGYAMYCHLAT